MESSLRPWPSVELWQSIFLLYLLASVAVALADYLVDFNHVTNSLFLSFHHHLFPLLGYT
jgi:hypothetical protein